MAEVLSGVGGIAVKGANSAVKAAAPVASSMEGISTPKIPEASPEQPEISAPEPTGAQATGPEAADQVKDMAKQGPQEGIAKLGNLDVDNLQNISDAYSSVEGFGVKNMEAWNDVNKPQVQTEAEQGNTSGQSETGTSAGSENSIPVETTVKNSSAAENLTDKGLNQQAIDAVTQRVNENKSQGVEPTPEDIIKMYNEELGRAEGATTAPVAGNSTEGSTRTLSTQETTDTPQQPPHAEANVSETTPQANAKITDNIRNSDEFKQFRNDAQNEASKKGEQIREEDLDKKALEKYNQQRNEQQEQSQLTPEQQKVQQLEEKMDILARENADLKTEISDIKATLATLESMLQVLMKMMADKEEDPKRKETLLQLLLKIAGIIALSTVTEVAKEENPLKEH